MKKWIGLIIILAALVLGGYYAMGMVTEKTLQKNISVINQTNGLTVHVDHFDRGLYTSKAMLNWQLHTQDRVIKGQNGQISTIPAQNYTIKMPLTIYNGPIIFSDSGLKFGLGYAHSDVSMPDEYVPQFASLFTDQSTKPNLSLSLFVSYLNKSHLHIDVPTFKLIFKQGGDIFQWGGMDSYIDVSSTMQNISGGFTVNGAQLVKNKMKATLGKVTSDYALHLTEAGIYLGDANLSLPSFLLSENDQNILDVEDFTARSSSDVDTGLFSSRFNTSLSKVVANGKTYGPLILEIALRNLDAGVLAEINNEVNKAQQGSDTERQQALLAMLPQLPKLLSKGAQFEVSKLNFVVPEGTIEGNMLIALPNGGTANPFQLLQKLVGHGKLQVPQAMLKQVIVASVKQKLLSQPSLQQAVIQQMKNTDTTRAAASVQPGASTTSTPSDTAVQAKADEPAATATATATAQPQPTEPVAGTATTPSPSVATPSEPGQPVSSAPVVQGQPPAGQVASGEAKPLTDAEIQQEAEVLADQKLSAMIHSGLVTLQGKEYVTELNLAEGQLTVNGKPFTQSMMQF
ncbi:MAG: YdgA family protein [Legionellales bacterium]|nr:YdgA family protein [Legionellales bacterium]